MRFGNFSVFRRDKFGSFGVFWRDTMMIL